MYGNYNPEGTTYNTLLILCIAWWKNVSFLQMFLWALWNMSICMFSNIVTSEYVIDDLSMKLILQS